ncbi:hypothetical protein [Asaia bogorensis]|uniref:hypothetical protein n=1 Tax=Asaia bogorensis TaxID=91915 RepID=UPI0013CE901B|nr:hypothetical protein [Asaia bogorensis]
MILVVQAIIREANIGKGYAGWRQYRMSHPEPMRWILQRFPVSPGEPAPRVSFG